MVETRPAGARPRVWVSQPLFDDIVGRLAEYFEVLATDQVTKWSPQQVAAALDQVDGALVTLNERIGAGEIETAHGLRAIANVGVGYNNLDIPALSARGIVATNTPEVLNDTTADMAFALLMAAARRITEGERWLREGHWTQWSFNTLLGVDVQGSTLGILGMGRIGQGIAQRAAHGFGMRVLYHNRSRLPESIESNCRARYVDFATLLEEADHLVLVLPYSADTHHVIDSAALAKMKSTATLINIGRGGLVDEGALADALAAGKLFAAGLDVFEGEPDINPKLLALRNVVLTPHVGSASLSTRRAMATLAVDNLIAALGHGPQAGQPATPVNAVDVAAHIAKTGKSITGKR